MNLLTAVYLPGQAGRLQFKISLRKVLNFLKKIHGHDTADY